MNNRKILFFAIFMLLLFHTVNVLGQNRAVFGINYLTAMPNLIGDDFEGIKVDPAGLPGGVVEFTYERFYLHGSYNSADFQWNYSDPDQNLMVKREKLSFRLGYAMSSSLYLFAAAQNFHFQGDSDSFTMLNEFQVPYQTAYGLDYAGFLFGGGIAAVMQFPGSPLFLKWSAAFLTGEMELKKSENDELMNDFPRKHTTSLTDIFIGLGYKLESGLALLVGYKAGFSGEEQGEERMHGILATLSYELDM